MSNPIKTNNYDDIKEGEKKQISKTIREIDGVKYSEYTYISKLKGGKIHKQIVKSKYSSKKQDKPKSKSSDSEEVNDKQQKEEKIKTFVNEYKKQMIISLQNLIKVQFNENITIEELNNM